MTLFTFASSFIIITNTLNNLIGQNLIYTYTTFKARLLYGDNYAKLECQKMHNIFMFFQTHQLSVIFAIEIMSLFKIVGVGIHNTSYSNATLIKLAVTTTQVKIRKNCELQPTVFASVINNISGISQSVLLAIFSPDASFKLFFFQAFLFIH